MPRSLADIIKRQDELADAFEAYDSSHEDEGKASPLLALKLAAAQRVNAEHAILDAVDAARGARVSWAAIGTLLDTSGEAARQRYGQLLSR